MATPPTGKAARNERTKLEANSLNAIGLAVAAVGVIQPVYTAAFSRDLAVRVAVSAVIAYLMHWFARRLLRKLED